METCDVLIAGGGPAGSACAWKLRQAGLAVTVIDKAIFPRDKVCAGWITPQVIDNLRIDPNEYRHGRTFQPITGFRVGTVGGRGDVDTVYDRPVSFGIRRCEFDDYLLRRAGARLALGTAVSLIRRDASQWVVNETFKAPMLVGAGGHFCPVARRMNDALDGAALVAAQEVEFAVDSSHASSFAIAAEKPELYFCKDLGGYGWCFRKGGYLNIGFGRLDARALPKATADFVTFLQARGKIPAAVARGWRGHAYLVSGAVSRRAVDDGVVLVGDAAGLAYPQSGEGIRPAVESGLLAASTIIEAMGHYSRSRLEPYARELDKQFRVGPLARLVARTLPASLPATIGGSLLDRPWFVRHILLDRWFLHAHQPALARG